MGHARTVANVANDGFSQPKRPFTDWDPCPVLATGAFAFEAVGADEGTDVDEDALETLAVF